MYDFSDGVISPKHNRLCLDGDEEYIKEGLIRTYPTDYVERSICGAFNFTKDNVAFLSGEYDGVCHVGCSNGTDFILIYIKCSDSTPHSLSNIDQFMQSKGWFKASSKIDDSLGIYMLCLNYEMKFDNAYVPVNGELMYHITPAIYINKINHIGLVPKESTWTKFGHGSRIYLFSSKMANTDEVKSYIEDFINGKKKRVDKHEEYCILSIDTSRLRQGIPFYRDSRIKGGVYTLENIPRRAIIDIKPIN